MTQLLVNDEPTNGSKSKEYSMMSTRRKDRLARLHLLAKASILKQQDQSRRSPKFTRGREPLKVQQFVINEPLPFEARK